MTRLVVDRQMDLPTGLVQLVRLQHDGPTEDLFRRENVYWVDLCLTPRRPNARARYVDRWGDHRDAEMGVLIALPPGELVHLRSAGGRHVSVLCQLRADAVQRWWPEGFDWNDRRLEACLDISSDTIRGLMLRLAQELRHPGVASEALAEAVTFQLSIELARYFAAISDSTETGGLADWRLRVIDRQLAEPGASPSLGDLAALCNMSVRQLTRGFRMSRGCSIGDYVAQRRTELAKRRLATEESIKAIASAMGYASQANFTYAFRRATGVTPSQFRSRVLRGGERASERELPSSSRPGAS